MWLFRVESPGLWYYVVLQVDGKFLSTVALMRFILSFSFFHICSLQRSVLVSWFLIQGFDCSFRVQTRVYLIFPTFGLIYFLIASVPYLLCPWRWRQHVPLKYWYPHTRLHGVTAEKTVIWRCIGITLKVKLSCICSMFLLFYVLILCNEPVFFQEPHLAIDLFVKCVQDCGKLEEFMCEVMAYKIHIRDHTHYVQIFVWKLKHFPLLDCSGFGGLKFILSVLCA